MIVSRDVIFNEIIFPLVSKLVVGPKFIDQMHIIDQEKAAQRLHTMMHHATGEVEYHYDDIQQKASTREEQAGTKL